MRAFGLLLLVVAHTWAPSWLTTIRTFDVPLMVFISAMCYKPLRGGYLAYCIKRFKRIYIPVTIFLTIFFTTEIMCYMVIGKPHIDMLRIIGSFLLLNSPSIGYVWIMRVFLMMALLLPLWRKILDNRGFVATIIIVIGLILLQQFLVLVVEYVDNKIIRSILDETLLYAIGYSPIAILGLKIQQFKRNELIWINILSIVVVLCFIIYNDWTFDPQTYKYPPQALYIIYGIFGSNALWLMKPLLTFIGENRFTTYISKNSMWIYLWHIIPVFIIAPWGRVPNLWFARYCFVLIFALALNCAYKYVKQKFIRTEIS